MNFLKLISSAYFHFTTSKSLISNSARIINYSKGFRRRFAVKTTAISVYKKKMETKSIKTKKAPENIPF